jgi:hypothetical protein
MRMSRLWPIDNPYIDRGARQLTRLWQAFAGLQPVHTVIGWLRRTAEGTCPEHTFHGVQSGLDQVVEIPDLVRVTRSSEPEVNLHSEPSALRRYASGSDGGSDRIFPGLFMRSRKSRWPPSNLDPYQVPIGHAARVARLGRGRQPLPPRL